MRNAPKNKFSSVKRNINNLLGVGQTVIPETNFLQIITVATKIPQCSNNIPSSHAFYEVLSRKHNPQRL